MLEDFADLDIDDEPSGSSREDRIRSAFEESKKSYANELVVTEPGWYDPPQVPPPTKLHIRNIDYTLYNLYLKRFYSQALALALSQIEAEERNLTGSGREGREFQLLDLAIRCALRLGEGEKELAGRLADKTRRKWLSNVGLATTSAEAYLTAGRPRDALSAILTVISIRGPQITIVPILHDALSALAKELQNTDSEGPQGILQRVGDYITWRRNPSNAQAPEAVDEPTAREWLNQCAITGSDQETLVALLSHKPSISFEREIEGSEERSVRTL